MEPRIQNSHIRPVLVNLTINVLNLKNLKIEDLLLEKVKEESSSLKEEKFKDPFNLNLN